MRASRHTTASAAAVLTLLALCSACSSSDTAAVGRQYEAIVKSTDKALTHDRSVKHPNLSLARYSVDFHRAAVQIAALTFPDSLKHDARALVTALNLLSADAEKAARAAAKPQNVLSNVQAFAKLNLTLMEDEKSEQTLSNTLRLALGLPRVTTTTTTRPSTLTPATLVPTPTTLVPTPTTVPHTTTPS